MRRDSLESTDLAFFSGFVAGDGSFAIRPNNAGASWCCSLGIDLRADNTPLLASFRAWSGAGELSPKQAHGRARPQTAWTVRRRLDCLRIAAILSRRPPLGKAALQYRIWRRAVRIWVTDGGGSPALADLAADLSALRRHPRPVLCPVDISGDDLAAFLAGFASAEAHFGTSAEGSASFVINLRADDGPLLRVFHETFELGHLREVAPAGRSRAAVSWRVGRLRDLRRLVALFDAHPPRGRAADVYAAWRDLVTLEVRTPAARRAAAVEIRRRRRFAPGLNQIESTSRGERRMLRCATALRSWAQSGGYPGSSVDYERWRRSSGRGAPTRDTIATAYGSWRKALEATGLDTTSALPEERVAAIRAGNAPALEARRAAAREAIVDVVRRCTAELGREPRAMEFLRWRAVHAPDCGSQMTVFRLFPGGFTEVLAAARSAAGSAPAVSAGQLGVQLD